MPPDLGPRRTYLTRLDPPGRGLRVAVKGCVAVRGLPTTSGSASLAARARPEAVDAACLAGIRAAEAAGRARLVGVTTLHELCFGVTGINAFAGTPRNPLDPRLAPGGSSSGSAAAVGEGSAEVAIGTDTGGSVRIPAACCGVAGLKTTRGRLPLEGVQPLAPSLDTLGPLAPDCGGLAEALALLDPAFPEELATAWQRVREGRLRIGRLGLPADPLVDQACDRLLARLGLETRPLHLASWRAADQAARVVLLSEAATTLDSLLAPTGAEPPGVGPDVAERLERARRVRPEDLEAARLTAGIFTAELAGVLADVDLLALPTLAGPVPEVTDAARLDELRLTLPANLAGLPALALPAPARQGPPASLQLLAPRGADALLVAVGLALQDLRLPRLGRIGRPLASAPEGRRHGEAQ
ncbi:amidase family protein [Aciditerrimonas ferrireducens]|uniref:Amidase family protein n=1 Tax=Aciditerrimonas ferrireducens TaxID=667306 RepID=A0ABV6C3J9_9ACTN